MPSKKKCCPNCIGDRGLKKQIFPIYHKQLTAGVCSYCKIETDSLIDPVFLKQHFELLINLYIQDDAGKSLIECLKDDWSMFPKMDIPNCKELLSDILDDGEIVRKTFIPNSIQSNRLDNWGKLREELMCQNRFFPKIGIEKDHLTELLERLAKLLIHLTLDPVEVPEIWYRARIQETNIPYNAKDMGAPPKDKTTPGRANPAGIPYLYIASTADTAVSEIRPHTGELVSVADITLPKELKIIDLQNPRKMVSPFTTEEIEEIALLRGGDLEFLEHLGSELTRPVLPRSAAIEYIPSQYLCEYIKKCGYDGVIYKSAVGDGINLALFLPELAKINIVKQHKVKKVSVEHERLA